LYNNIELILVILVRFYPFNGIYTTNVNISSKKKNKNDKIDQVIRRM